MAVFGWQGSNSQSPSPGHDRLIDAVATMAKTYWYFMTVALLVLIPLIAVLLVKKLGLLEIRPDEQIAYKVFEGQKRLLHSFKAKTDRLGSPPPAMLLFHGGAWQYGSGKKLYPQCRFFAENGLTCFVVQYRLGSRGVVDVPGAVEDASDALAYLRANASQLNIDADRIVAGGGSSGGQLAAALGVAIHKKAGKPMPVATRRPAALILYNPMLDLSPGMPDHDLVKDDWQEISPYHHVDGSVPPTLILLGTEDVELPVASAESFCRMIIARGGRCELALYQGQQHGFFQYRENNREYFDKTNARIMTFLESIWE
ncbi:MAG: alpha/beta hydrolase [Pseudomonadales bacterium]|nr:alpha/beta hydrolase [Pseudomonadales bacterium]